MLKITNSMDNIQKPREGQSPSTSTPLFVATSEIKYIINFKIKDIQGKRKKSKRGKKMNSQI